MKKYLFAYLLFCSILAPAQTELVTFENSLNDKAKPNLKEVIPIVNEKNNDISLFFLHPKKVYGYLLNKNFELIDKISSEDRSRKFKVLLGNSISSNNDYRIYLTNPSKKKFVTINFSYEKQVSEFKELDLNFNEEHFLQTITKDNRFYLISIVKNSSKFNIYQFDDQANYSKKEVDFSAHSFINHKGKEVKLYDLLFMKIPGSLIVPKILMLEKIDLQNPNHIESVADLNKLILRDNEIIFCFDQNKEFAQLAIINLNTLETQTKKFKKPLYTLDKKSKRTNSFISNDHVYLVASTPEKFSFTVKDYTDDTLIKRYNLSVDDSIHFKNTPIIQKGGVYVSYRELEKTRKFLRKITNGNIGISSYEKDGFYHVMIGGKELIRSGGPMFMPMGGAVGGAAAGTTMVFFNPAFHAYGAYSQTKATHIKGLFNKDFEHVKGDMPKNAFDKINDFKKENSGQRWRTVFKYDEYFVLVNGYLWKNKYTLRMFKD